MAMTDATPSSAQPAQAVLREAVHERIAELFTRDSAVFGRDLAPYRGHAQRVAALVMGQVDMRPDWVEPVAVASYYHDAAIWFEHTWDYLPDSESLAAQELSRTGHEGDAALVTAMIDEHHRVRPARNPHPLVEATRRADATDVYRLPLPPHVSRDDYRAMLKRFPDNGMHLMLGRGFVMGLKEHKRLNPMPMVKL